MYTSEGLFTRELSFEYYQTNFGQGWNGYVWSLHWLSDSPVFVHALFAVAAIAAVFLIVGKWTRIATLVSWILLASLHVRNPLVTTSGDFLFKMMLFWSIFLPLSARWSIDSKKADQTGSNSICSIASVAYVIQLFTVYFFPGIAKWNSTWFSGEAMSYVMRLDIYIRDFGKMLLEYPEMLAAASWITLFAELVLIWTLFSTWNNGLLRLLNMIVFFSFHVAIALALGIGIFPWICMVAWIPLLPSFIWRREKSESVESTFDWNVLPAWKMATEIFCLAALGLVLAWNLTNMSHSMRPPLMKQVGYLLAVDQHFQMFGVPPDQNPWFAYEGQLKGGDQMDIWRNAKIDRQRPASGLEVFPNFHWRKLHRNALLPVNQFLRQPLLDHAVRTWNDEHPDKPVVKARLICFREEIGPNYNNLNYYSDVWGTFADEEKSIGSLFEQFMKEQGGDLDF